jgi:hypothetical protein
MPIFSVELALVPGRQVRRLRNTSFRVNHDQHARPSGTSRNAPYLASESRQYRVANLRRPVPSNRLSARKGSSNLSLEGPPAL